MFDSTFICSRCGREFPEEARYSKKTKRCKPCYNVFVRQRREECLDWLREYKESNPCTDCGEHFHFAAMEFDHVRGEKYTNIARMKMMSRSRILEEIEKCELVCANCHRVRTYNRNPRGGVKNPRGTAHYH